jgi:hypothetical protein
MTHISQGHSMALPGEGLDSARRDPRAKARVEYRLRRKGP